MNPRIRFGGAFVLLVLSAASLLGGCQNGGPAPEAATQNTPEVNQQRSQKSLDAPVPAAATGTSTPAGSVTK